MNTDFKGNYPHAGTRSGPGAVILAAAILALLLLPVTISGQNDAPDRDRQSVTMARGPLTNTLIRAKEELAMFLNQEEQALTRADLARSKCIVVFPEHTRGSLIIGVTLANGVAVCRIAPQGQTELHFVNLLGVSFGLQAGLETGPLVILMSTVEGAREITRGQFHFGVELNLTLGPIYMREMIRANPGHEVRKFKDMSGLHAGAFFEGAYLKSDKNETRSFYRNEMVNMDTDVRSGARDAERGFQDLLILLPTD